MSYQKKFLWIISILSISFSVINANSEKDNTLSLAPSGILEIDVMQSFNKDNKSGSAAIGRLETGIEASVGKKVETGLFLELQDENKIGLLETWFTFIPFKPTSLTIGQLTMPFGEYKTELLTDPLVMCGYEGDSVEILGAETICPGFIVGFNRNGFSSLAAYYNSLYSGLFEAFTVKLGYTFKDIVSTGASFRFESGSKIGFSANFSTTPIKHLTIIGEFYTGLNNGKSNNKLLGIHNEINILPTDPLVIVGRFGWLVDSKDQNFGAIQIAGGTKYVFKEHMTIGLEINAWNSIVNNKTQGFNNFGLRIGFCIE